MYNTVLRHDNSLLQKKITAKGTFDPWLRLWAQWISPLIKVLLFYIVNM